VATSAITVSALTAVANIQGNKLAWAVTDPNNGAIPNIALDKVEVWRSTTNDRDGTAAKVGEGLNDFTDQGLIEEQTYYYWTKARNRIGSYGAWHPTGNTSGVACTAKGLSGLAFGLANGKIVVTHNSPSSNQLTIAIKTASGNDPSASDPVYIAFPNATITNGNYQIRQISAALSLTISNGSTLGVNANSKPFRLWFVIFDDGGTLRLGVRWCSDGTAIIRISDGARDSATAEGGAGAADSAIFYANATITSKAYRIIGYADWSSGLSVIGVWGTAPDAVRLVGSGLREPAQVLFEVSSDLSWTASSTFTALIPYDDTIPQIGEGTALFDTAVFTPQSTINTIEVEIMLNVAHSVATEFILAVFKDGAANAVKTAVEYIPAADKVCQIHFKARMQALSTSPVTLAIRAGAVNAGTTTVNGVSGARKLGGAYNSTYAFRELAG
jgi:hypothetical protein